MHAWWCPQQYIITDHPHLVSGPMQGLFEALRKAILALDPCVNEEFLKLYVAYKAETNFVDVVPQAKRLLLVLNLGGFKSKCNNKVNGLNLAAGPSEPNARHTPQ